MLAAPPQMPSHIDAWVGQWKEGIECNIDGVTADDKFVEQSGKDSMFYKFYRMHNHHFVVWCSMFDGQYATAIKYARKMEAQLPAGDKDSGVQFMLAGIIPMGAIFLESYLNQVWHVFVRFGKWDEVCVCVCVHVLFSLCVCLRYADRAAAAAGGTDPGRAHAHRQGRLPGGDRDAALRPRRRLRLEGHGAGGAGRAEAVRGGAAGEPGVSILHAVRFD
eukprot:COSAG01_NODE_1178_length_11365_cov_22.270613_11_plen_219_part_00